MSHPGGCEGCGAKAPIGEMQFDLQGRQLCRRCHGTDLAKQADQVQRSHGVRRLCGKCKQDALLRAAPFAPLVLEGGGREQPYTVGFHYQCARCPHHVIILSQGGVLLLGVIVVFAAIAAATMQTSDERWVARVFLGLVALVALREAHVRGRNPVREG